MVEKKNSGSNKSKDNNHLDKENQPSQNPENSTAKRRDQDTFKKSTNSNPHTKK